MTPLEPPDVPYMVPYMVPVMVPYMPTRCVGQCPPDVPDSAYPMRRTCPPDVPDVCREPTYRNGVAHHVVVERPGHPGGWPYRPLGGTTSREEKYTPC
jgi:hypothetical protein